MHTFSYGGGIDVQVMMQEAESLIGFTTDAVDVVLPFEVTPRHFPYQSIR
jgi:hypothetical protein